MMASVRSPGRLAGTYFNLSTSLDPAFERIARETSASYVVTFEPADEDRDGKSHNVGVKVGRSGVTIRARKQFTVDPSVRTAPVAQRLSRALNSPYLPASIPMDLTTYVVRDAEDGGLRVLLAAEIGCGAQAAADFEVGHIVTDSAGNGQGSTVARPEAIVSRGKGVRCAYYTSTFGVKTGEYAVRAVAMDSGNRAGGVERHLDARLMLAGPLGLSSLVLTDPAVRVDGRDEAGGQRACRRPRRRRISRNAAPPACSGRGGRSSTAGRAICSAPRATIARRSPVSFRRSWTMPATGAWYAEGSINLATLAPGTYVMRAIVVWDGAIVGRVTGPSSWTGARPVSPPPHSSRQKNPACRDGMRGVIAVRGCGAGAPQPQCTHTRTGTARRDAREKGLESVVHQEARVLLHAAISGRS